MKKGLEIVLAGILGLAPVLGFSEEGVPTPAKIPVAVSPDYNLKEELGTSKEEKLAPVAEKSRLFVCNNIVDCDKSGDISPAEHFGKKDQIRQDENLTLVCDIKDPAVGKQFELFTYDSGGNVRDYANMFLGREGLLFVQRGLMGRLAVPGNYTSVAKINGTVIAKKDYRINPMTREIAKPENMNVDSSGWDLFFYNLSKDFGNDGKADFDADFSGTKKDRFDASELFGFGMRPKQGEKGNTIGLDVYSTSRGNKIYSNSRFLTSEQLLYSDVREAILADGGTGVEYYTFVPSSQGSVFAGKTVGVDFSNSTYLPSYGPKVNTFAGNKENCGCNR